MKSVDIVNDRLHCCVKSYCVIGSSYVIIDSSRYAYGRDPSLRQVCGSSESSVAAYGNHSVYLMFFQICNSFLHSCFFFEFKASVRVNEGT